MFLPNKENAIIDARKISSYLLNITHSEGAGKAFFFLQYGFISSEWKALAQAIKKVAEQNQIRETMVTKYGVKYIIDGLLHAPDGRKPRIRTVWFIEGNNLPKFVTAYPIKK